MANVEPTKKTYELTASSISYTKPASAVHDLLFKPCKPPTPPTYILRDVTFTARPGELVAVVGPSGAGKSTLLDILAARIAPTSGDLLLNSSPLHPSTFRKLSAHVPQHDAFLPQLSVTETFAFAAALLVPDGGGATVSNLLTDLRLTHVAHTRLAGNLSGGERRRVSIGLSLLHNPAVLLLDEPTSGLDSASAYTIVQVLRSVAAARRATVILSIHQPSSKILAAIDAILLLSKGRVIYHGDFSSLDTYLVSFGFSVPTQLNALEYAMEVLHQLPQPTENTPETNHLPYLKTRSRISYNTRYARSRVYEILTLYERSWKIVFRTRQLLLTNAIEALLVGFVLGTIYIKLSYDDDGIRKRLGLFAFTLTFLLSSTTETLPIFVGERQILLREASSGVYRLTSHLIASSLVFLPYLVIIAIIYSAAVYFLVGLCFSAQAFASFVLIVWAILLTANSFVMFAGSLAPDYIAGTSLVTVSLAGFFLFSGYFISRKSMPDYWLFMHYMSPYKYALDALLANEYSCAAERCFETSPDGGVACAMTGREVLAERGLREGQQWANLQVLVGFFVFYRVLYWLVLARRSSRSKR